MPESKKRKKDGFTAPSPALAAAARRRRRPSPVWLAPLMLTMFGLGLLWLVVYYLSGGTMPLIGNVGGAGLLIGFGFIIVGFALATQWR